MNIDWRDLQFVEGLVESRPSLVEELDETHSIRIGDYHTPAIPPEHPFNFNNAEETKEI